MAGEWQTLPVHALITGIGVTVRGAAEGRDVRVRRRGRATRAAGARLAVAWCILGGTIAMPAQEQSPRVSVQAEVTYDDILRRTSPRSALALDAWSRQAVVGLTVGRDSIALEIRSDRLLLSSEQRITGIRTRVVDEYSAAELSYSSSAWLLHYTASAIAPLSDGPVRVGGGLTVRLDPFGRRMVLGAEWSRRRRTDRWDLAVSNFDMRISESVVPTNIGVWFALAPGTWWTMSAGIRQSWQGGADSLSNDGLSHDARSAESWMELGMRPSEGLKVGLRGDWNSVGFSGALLEWGQGFGSLNAGKWSTFSVASSVEWKWGTTPVRASYAFTRIHVSGVGHVESWPFVDLASSLILNRLYYRMRGDVDFHELGGATEIVLGSFRLSPTLAHYVIQSDVHLDHWEPEFLVFGIRNFQSDRLPFRRSHLLRMGLTAALNVGGCTIGMEASQYVPVSMRTWGVEPGAPVALPEAAGSAKTDGGRSIRLFVRW